MISNKYNSFCSKVSTKTLINIKDQSERDNEVFYVLQYFVFISLFGYFFLDTKSETGQLPIAFTISPSRPGGCFNRFNASGKSCIAIFLK